MSQPSVASYFSTRKRLACDDLKSTSAKKVLVLDSNSADSLPSSIHHPDPTKDSKLTCTTPELRQIVMQSGNKINNTTMAKKPKQTKIRKLKEVPNQRDLQTLLNNVTTIESNHTIVQDLTPKGDVNKEPIHRTPPSTPIKRVNAMDNVKPIARELSFNELKQKMSRSSRLAELKASISKFKQLDTKLQEVEKKTSKIEDSPNLKSFKTIELEVALRYVLFKYYNSVK